MVNIFDIFEKHASENLDRFCLKIYPSGEELTYGNLLLNVEKLANYFVRKGLSVGDKILVEGIKSVETFSILMAALKIGVTYSFFDPNSPEHRQKLLIQSYNPDLIINKHPTNFDCLIDAPKICFSDLHKVLNSKLSQHNKIVKKFMYH